MGVTRCILLLGGSFDPVHNGHIALAEHFNAMLQPDELRLIPAGNPWQKSGLQASASDRVRMLELAFASHTGIVTIDQQEIHRTGPSYTIDTLRAIRAEVGPQTSLVFLMGADQLQNLPSWHQWQQLFDYANLCVVSRPGFSLEANQVPDIVQQEFAKRHGSLAQCRVTPAGLTYLSESLLIDISATEIRAALQHGDWPAARMPAAVLDYIKLHHLYQS